MGEFITVKGNCYGNYVHTDDKDMLYFTHNSPRTYGICYLLMERLDNEDYRIIRRLWDILFLGKCR